VAKSLCLPAYLLLLAAMLAGAPARAQNGSVTDFQKISATEGAFTGALDDGDLFGRSVATLGDLDGDGVADLAVGARADDDGDTTATNRGAVWILFLNADGSVKAHQKISDTQGGFSGVLDDGDLFGGSVCGLGDLDGDGIVDLAVGAPDDDDGGSNRGAVWILFLNVNGTVKSHQKISDADGAFAGTLDDGDFFGAAVAVVGDLDGDEQTDLIVGAGGDDDGGSTGDADRGALWVLFLNPNGTVKAHQKISDTDGGFAGTLDDGDGFGVSAAPLGDLDGDGVVDLAAGAFNDDDGGAANDADRGAVWILFLNADGTVKAHQKISETSGGFNGDLDQFDSFGIGLVALGDVDGDGVAELAVGADGDDDGGGGRGAVWILFLNENGTVAAHQKIGHLEGNFAGALENNDSFGIALASLGDRDGDGVHDLVVGAIGDDDGGVGTTADRGAVWLLTLQGIGFGEVIASRKLSETAGGFSGTLDDFDQWGYSLAPLDDLDGDGVMDVAIGAPADDDGGGGSTGNRGAVWIGFLNPDGSVKAHQKISDTAGGFTGILDVGDNFGDDVAALGDLDGDGVVDLAVGAVFDDDGGEDRGAVWILFLNADGAVKSHQKISDTEGGFAGTLDDGDNFGAGLAPLGDLDGDGVVDLAVGAAFDDDGGEDRGAVWILFLNSDGAVKSHQKISDAEGGFAGTLDNGDGFGGALAALGDLDRDGILDLAVGAIMDDDGGSNRGAVWVLFLNADGAVKSHQKISMTSGGFTGALDSVDLFGNALTALGDLNADGVADLAVGALADDDGGTNRGSVWILFLNADGAVRMEQKISDTAGNFPGTLDNGDNFGSALALLADMDRDGAPELAVGARLDDDGGSERGAVWILSLKAILPAPGAIVREAKISDTRGYFSGGLDDGDVFGQSVAPLGDLDGDGVVDLAVGAPLDVNGGIAPGAVWILFMNRDGTVRDEKKIDTQSGGFTGVLDDFDQFGRCVAPVGDLDDDGIPDLAVGAPSDDDGAGARGAVWILFLNADGAVKSHQKISSIAGGFTGDLDDVDTFGSSVADLGDLDGDGNRELAVGAVFDDDGGSDIGAVWILFLNNNGTVKTLNKISKTAAGFTGALDDGDRFGHSVAGLGDIDGDGVPDLAIGAPNDDDGGAASNANRGAVWIVFLNANGSIKGLAKVSDTAGDFPAVFEDNDSFGSGVAGLGDLDGDGVGELGVGVALDDDGGSARGAAWILFLRANGAVRAYLKISETTESFHGVLDDNDNFGASLAALGDLDGDGVVDLAVGAPADDDGGALVTSDRGAIWLFTLRGVPIRNAFRIADADPAGNNAPTQFTNERTVLLEFEQPCAFGVTLYLSQDDFATSTAIHCSRQTDFPISLDPGADGTRAVHARFHNAKGFSAPIGASMLLDTTLPSASTPTDADVFTNNTLIAFNWTAPADGGSGIASSILQVGTTPGASNIFNAAVTGQTSQQVAGADGQTLFARLIAADNAGNVRTTGNSNGITIDTSAPVAQTPFDDGDFTNSTQVSFNWTAPTDAVSGIASTILQVGTTPGASDIFNAAVTGQTSQQVAGADGQTLFARLIVTDNVGNQTTTGNSDGITIDTSLPTAQPPADEGVFSTSVNTTFHWIEPVDEISGIESVVLQVGASPGASDIFNAAVTGQTSQQVAGADGQTLFARLIVTDNLGNETITGNSDGITIDVSLPSVPTPADAGDFSTGVLVTFTWTAPTDAVSGVASSILQIGATPGASNIFNASVLGQTSKQIAGTDGQTLYARLIVADNAGNEAISPDSNGITIDLLPPVAQPPLDDGLFSTGTQIVFDWAAPVDAVSGVASTILQIGAAPGANDLFDANVTGQTTQEIAGAETQTLFARLIVADVAGNTTTTASSDGITIDTIPPSVSAPIDTGAFSTSASLTFNWTAPTDAGSGIAATTLRVGAAPDAGNIFEGDVTGLISRQITGADGETVYAHLIAVDLAGNRSISGNSDGILIDVSPPVAQSPTDAGAFSTTPLITFQWTAPTDAVSGVASSVLQIGTAPGANDLFDGSVLGQTSKQIAGADGQMLFVRLIVTDVAGNVTVTPASDGILIDTVAPTAQTPSDGGDYSTSTLVTFTWPAPTDAVSGVASLVLQVGSTPGAANIFNASVLGQTARQVTGANGQTLFARLIVTDNAGNVTTTPASDGILIDTVAPTAAAPTDEGTYSTTTTLTFSWAAPTDDVSGVATALLQIGTAAGLSDLLVADVTTTTSLRFGGAHGQTVFARLVVTDHAGNRRVTASSNGILIDTQAPLAAAPTDDGTFSSVALIVIRWTAPGDPVSGIDSVLLQLGSAPNANNLFEGIVTGQTIKLYTAAEGQTVYARLIVKDRAGNTTTTASSDGITIDTITPPINPPTDGGAFSITTNVTFSWASPVDDGSGITDLTLRVGSTPGGNDIFEGSVLGQTSQVVVGAEGQTLFGRLTVTDGAGNSRASANSDGIHIDTIAPAALPPTNTGDYSRSVQVGFNWTTPTDNDTGVAAVILRVGTTPGAQNILSDNVTGQTSRTANGGDGQTLYAHLVVIDVAGNVTVTGPTDGILIDVSAPTAPTPSDAGVFSTGTLVAFNWIAPFDAVSGVDTTVLQIGAAPGASNLFNGNVTTQTSKQILGADGQSLFARLVVADKAGNVTTSTNSNGILIDSVDPVALPPTDAGVYSLSPPITFNWPLPSDSISGIASARLQVGTAPGGTEVFNGLVTGQTSRQVTGADGQTLYARLVVADNAGNTTTTASTDGILIDTGAPAAAAPVDEGVYSTTSLITFTWAAPTDAVSGIASTFLQIGTAPGAGNLFDGDVTTQTSMQIAGADGQTLYARLIATDHAGRVTTTPASDGILIDISSPVVGAPTDAGVFSRSTPVTFQWPAPSDAVSGVASSTLQIGATPGGNDLFHGSVLGQTSRQQAAEDGQTLYARLIVADRAGNTTTTTSSDGILIDVSLPEAHPPTDEGTYTSKTLVAFGWIAPTDAVSGIAATNLRIGATPGSGNLFNGDVTTLTAKQIVGAEAQTLFAQLTVLDNAGNTTTTASSDGITIDTIPPVAFPPTDEGAFSTSTATTFHWVAPTDATSGVDSVVLQVGTIAGGNDLFDDEVTGQVSQEITGDDGQMLFARLIVADRAGNVTITSSTSSGNEGILIDTVPPLAEPPADDGEYSTGTLVEFHWTAPTDEVSGIASTILQVGASPGASNLFNGDVTTLTARQVIGAHGQTLHARLIVADKAGNTTTTDSSDGITIDTVRPVVGVDPLFTKLTAPELTGTIDDPQAAVRIEVDGQVIDATIDGAAWSAAIPVALDEGVHDVRATATDPAGNVGEDATVDELTINTTPLPILMVLDGVDVLNAGSSPISFGSTVQNGASLSRTFTVRNDGETTLTIFNLDIPNGFTLTEPLDTAIGVGASDTFTVMLPSEGVGTVNGKVTLHSDDIFRNPFRFSITGIVRYPADGELGSLLNYLLGLSSSSVGMDFNQDGGIDAADINYLIQRIPPAFPNSPSPDDRAGGVPLEAALKWKSDIYATSFRVWMWRIEEAPPAQPTATGLTSPVFAPSGLEYSTTYRWQVEAVGAVRASLGPVWRFTTQDPPPPPPPPVQLLEPNGGETVTIGAPVEVQWARAESAGTAFRVELWRNGQKVAELGIFLSEELSGANALTVPDVQPFEDYRLRLISIWMESQNDPLPYDESNGPIAVVRP
jgi:hypothetical protein